MRVDVKNQPLVSVIIIFLDEIEFLAEAVESVLAQTYGRWELLLIDDGSNDGSSEIARRHAEQYPEKVRYLEHAHHKNRGMSASRNLGVRHARGEYVALLDGDDVWLADKLERQVEILRLNPRAAMVCGPVQWWYSWTGSSEDLQRDSIVALRVEPNRVIEPPVLLACLLEHETVTTTVALLRRKAIEQAGGFEESFCGLYEDQAFFAKLCSQLPIFIDGDCLYRWRKHPQSSCSTAVREGQYRAARLRFLRWLEVYLRNRGISDREVWRSLHRELRRARYSRAHRALAAVRRSPRYALEGLKKLARCSLPAPVYRVLKRGCASAEIGAARRSAAPIPLDDDPRQ